MPGRVAPFINQFRQSLWPIPAAGVGVAVLVHWLLLRVDERLPDDAARWFVFGGGADSARSFLGTMATSILSMTTLVFSVTMLVLQLASSQLSPRVLSTFLRDRANQIVLGLFISTYAYVLLTLREVRDDFVPGMSVWAAFAAVMLSVAAFVYYIHHVAQSIRVVSVIHRVGGETRRAIERLYPAGIAQPAPPEPQPSAPSGAPSATYRWPRKSGVVIALREEAIEELCRESAAFVRLEIAVGDFVGRGSMIGAAWGADPPSEDAIAGTVVVGPERTVEQDALYGFRQLVDIAVRALSPGVNDPTTAIQVLDELHGLLIEIAAREIPSPVRADEAGRALVHLPRPDWDAYVTVSLDEIRGYGRDSIQVMRRTRHLIEDLSERVPESRRPILRRQLAQIDAAVESAFRGYDRGVALTSSRQGHGPVG